MLKLHTGPTQLHRQISPAENCTTGNLSQVWSPQQQAISNVNKNSYVTELLFRKGCRGCRPPPPPGNREEDRDNTASTNTQPTLWAAWKALPFRKAGSGSEKEPAGLVKVPQLWAEAPRAAAGTKIEPIRGLVLSPKLKYNALP